MVVKALPLPGLTDVVLFAFSFRAVFFADYRNAVFTLGAAFFELGKSRVVTCKLALYEPKAESANEGPD